MNYRVVYRRRASEDWQEQPFSTLRDAQRWVAVKRSELYAAKVQWWHETEQRWIG